MANGFQLTRPASHGSQQMNATVNVAVGTEFNCPGSGTQNISELGHFGDTDGGDVTFSIGMFTDDATNDCPESQVSNSDLDLTMPAAGTEIYGALDPVAECTGGVDYWLCFVSNGSALNMDRDPSGGNSEQGFVSGGAWPTPTEWEGFTSRNWDMGIWAIYAAAAGDLTVDVNEQSGAADGITPATGDFSVNVADCPKPIDKLI